MQVIQQASRPLTQHQEGPTHMHTQPTRHDAGIAQHSHHVNGADIDCDQLTHCPALCDCPVDSCTAVQADWQKRAQRLQDTLRASQKSSS